MAPGRVARWFSGKIGGPAVLVGEEITAPRWHLIGVGLRETVAWRQPLEAAIAAVKEHDFGIALQFDNYRSA